MNYFLIYCITFSCILILHVESAQILQRFFHTATVCEKYCSDTYEKGTLKASCEKGCRLLTIISLAKDLENDSNKTEKMCFSACEEAYNSAPEAKSCMDGCKKEAMSIPPKEKQDSQTLHLLTPLMYVKSAYKTVAHRVKQLITTSFTLYVEEDTGKMVVLQTNPKTIVELTNVNKDNGLPSDGKNSERSDWMDCLSQQSGLPRWILVSVLFGFTLTLLWLCCVTTVTAPTQHLSSGAKKYLPKKDVAYLYFYEPLDDVKIQPPIDEQAEPLPAKVLLP